MESDVLKEIIAEAGKSCPNFLQFGASYPDAVCINGYLWDLDSCENVDGEQTLSVGGDIPCPFCNTEEYIEHYKDDVDEDGNLLNNGNTRESLLLYIENLRERYQK